MIDLNDELLTYEELGALLKVKPKTLMNWMSDGRFLLGKDYIKTGKAKKSPVRFKRQAIMDRINKGKF